MHLDNFIEIISGKLLNSPCISSINNFTSKLENVCTGDAFLSRDKNAIKEAINRGAYAIVSDECLDIIDNEIAWILISDINLSILKFIKYTKLMNSIDIYLFDDISFKIAKNIIKDKQVAIVSNVYELLESISQKNIIINFDILLFDIYFLQHSDVWFFNIIKQTMFEMRISFDNEEYNLTLPSMFTSHLNNVIAFCKQRYINIALYVDSSEFLPIFITSSARISEYGDAMRFVYASKNHNLIKQYIDFVVDAKWGIPLCLTDKQYNGIECRNFDSMESLIDVFMDCKYHFFIVEGIDSSDLIGSFKREDSGLSLF